MPVSELNLARIHLARHLLIQVAGDEFHPLIKEGAELQYATRDAAIRPASPRAPQIPCGYSKLSLHPERAWLLAIHDLLQEPLRVPTETQVPRDLSASSRKPKSKKTKGKGKSTKGVK